MSGLRSLPSLWFHVLPGMWGNPSPATGPAWGPSQNSPAPQLGLGYPPPNPRWDWFNPWTGYAAGGMLLAVFCSCEYCKYFTHNTLVCVQRHDRKWSCRPGISDRYSAQVVADRILLHTGYNLLRLHRKMCLGCTQLKRNLEKLSHFLFLASPLLILICFHVFVDCCHAWTPYGKRGSVHSKDLNGT